MTMAMACKLLQEKFYGVERPSVGRHVSLLCQLTKLRLGSKEDLDDYFVRSQGLMTRLSEVGEAITGTLFNALVIIGMSDNYEHFLMQDHFQPAKAFPQLRKRLKNHDVSRKAPYGERTEHGHVAMRAVRKKKGVSSSGRYVCCQKSHMARECKSTSDIGQSSVRGSGLKETSGPAAKKQRCFKYGQPGHFSSERKQRRTGFISCSATTSNKGDNLTDHVVRDRAVFSSFEMWNEGSLGRNSNGMLSKRAKVPWKWISGTAMRL